MLLSPAKLLPNVMLMVFFFLAELEHIFILHSLIYKYIKYTNRIICMLQHFDGSRGVNQVFAQICKVLTLLRCNAHSNETGQAVMER